MAGRRVLPGLTRCCRASTARRAPEWAANAPQYATSIIGLDDATGNFSLLYADSRGVFRVYEMSLSDGVWKIWRDAPEFYQRFTGTFSDDGNTKTGQYEFSSDGTNWAVDFEATYRRVTPAEPRR